ncbi:MAG: Spy/CpxP family protein refolding chaperone [Legionella sp.]|nr:Spy/CpxP family protein refolding chaperone [Legionella sp.]
MKLKFLWLPLFSLALAASQPAVACPTNSEGKKCHCTSKNSYNQLSLSGEQQTKIKAIKVQTHDSLKNTYHQIKELNKEIDVLVHATQLDEAKLDLLINQRNKLKGAVYKSRVMSRHQIYTLLTEEQKNKLKNVNQKKS